MANRSFRGRMPVSERAKQFMPFAAVKGLNEALERKRRELVCVQKIELSEEMGAALDKKLRKLSKGMEITVLYYSNGEYLSQTGTLEKVDHIAHLLRISGRSFFFDDLLDIDIL